MKARFTTSKLAQYETQTHMCALLYTCRRNMRATNTYGGRATTKQQAKFPHTSPRRTPHPNTPREWVGSKIKKGNGRLYGITPPHGFWASLPTASDIARTLVPYEVAILKSWGVPQKFTCAISAPLNSSQKVIQKFPSNELRVADSSLR